MNCDYYMEMKSLKYKGGVLLLLFIIWSFRLEWGCIVGRMAPSNAVYFSGSFPILNYNLWNLGCILTLATTPGHDSIVEVIMPGLGEHMQKMANEDKHDKRTVFEGKFFRFQLLGTSCVRFLLYKFEEELNSVKIINSLLNYKLIICYELKSSKVNFSMEIKIMVLTRPSNYIAYNSLNKYYLVNCVYMNLNNCYSLNQNVGQVADKFNTMMNFGISSGLINLFIQLYYIFNEFNQKENSNFTMAKFKKIKLNINKRFLNMLEKSDYISNMVNFNYVLVEDYYSTVSFGNIKINLKNGINVVIIFTYGSLIVTNVFDYKNIFLTMTFTVMPCILMGFYLSTMFVTTLSRVKLLTLTIAMVLFLNSILSLYHMTFFIKINYTLTVSNQKAFIMTYYLRFKTSLIRIRQIYFEVPDPNESSMLNNKSFSVSDSSYKVVSKEKWYVRSFIDLKKTADENVAADLEFIEGIKSDPYNNISKSDPYNNISIFVKLPLQFFTMRFQDKEMLYLFHRLIYQYLCSRLSKYFTCIFYVSSPLMIIICLFCDCTKVNVDSVNFFTLIYFSTLITPVYISAPFLLKIILCLINSGGALVCVMFGPCVKQSETYTYAYYSCYGQTYIDDYEDVEECDKGVEFKSIRDMEAYLRDSLKYQQVTVDKRFDLPLNIIVMLCGNSQSCMLLSGEFEYIGRPLTEYFQLCNCLIMVNIWVNPCYGPDYRSMGGKLHYWKQRSVPISIEIGLRDLVLARVVMGYRFNKQKEHMSDENPDCHWPLVAKRNRDEEFSRPNCNFSNKMCRI